MRPKAEKQKSGASIGGRLKNLTLSIVIPFCLFAVLLIGFLITYSSRQAGITENMAKASGFNIAKESELNRVSFKDYVDDMMLGVLNNDSDELPTGRIDEARSLAETLLKSTSNKESIDQLNAVIEQCDSLKNSIRQIKASESYDERKTLLESDIYVLTRLITEDIYKYLYYESQALAEIQARLRASLIISVTLAVFTAAFITLVSFMRAKKISKSITKPIDGLYGRVIDIGGGSLEAAAPVAAEDEKLQTLSNGLEEMVRRLRDLMELNRQEQTKRREMEFALIQAQINPHFLYNTLDTIIWLIETEQNREAQEVVSSLSTYFRSFLSNGRDIVTLQDELQHVNSYLEIQQVRYSDILRFSIESDGTFDDCILPKMTLQPLVENAIYHGIKEKRGGGEIHISVDGDENRVRIRVADTGIGMNAEKLDEIRRLVNDGTSGFGMTAAYQRMLILFGEECRFTIDSTVNVGTAIEIEIPCRKEGEDKQ